MTDDPTEMFQRAKSFITRRKKHDDALYEDLPVSTHLARKGPISPPNQDRIQVRQRQAKTATIDFDTFRKPYASLESLERLKTRQPQPAKQAKQDAETTWRVSSIRASEEKLQRGRPPEKVQNVASVSTHDLETNREPARDKKRKKVGRSKSSSGVSTQTNSFVFIDMKKKSEHKKEV